MRPDGSKNTTIWSQMSRGVHYKNPSTHCLLALRKKKMREWMYVRLIVGYLNNEFVAGVEQFVEFCMTTVYYEKYGGKLRCPCRKCDNRRIIPVTDVKVHLYSRGFVQNYYHWVFQGETQEMFDAALQLSLIHI